MSAAAQMDCICTPKEVVEKKTINHENFLHWRDNQIKDYTKKCYALERRKNSNDTTIQHQISVLPKCMVHMTQKLCDCNVDCISKLFKSNTFDHTCKIFDLNNLYLDDKYIDCNFLDKKIFFDEFLPTDSQTNINEKMGFFYSDLGKACFVDEHFDKLKCDAYNIRDECQDNEDCKSNILSDGILENCEKLDEIYPLIFHRILDINPDKAISLRKKREYVDANDKKIVDKLMIRHPLVSNEPSELYNKLSDYSNHLEKCNTDDLVLTEKDYYLKYSIPISSGFLLSLITYLMCKNDNKNQGITTTILIVGAFIFVMSTYNLVSTI